MEATAQRELAQGPEKHQAKLQAFQAGDEGCTGGRMGGREGGRRETGSSQETKWDRNNPILVFVSEWHTT